MPRADRINEEIRYNIGMILQRDISDPRMGFVTITKVDTSPDLRSSSIYFTAMDDNGPNKDTLTVLKESKGFIRSLLAKRIRIKFIPRLTFIKDVSAVEKNRVDEIIDIIHRQKGV
jgi:ribosome-binding factor A